MPIRPSLAAGLLAGALVALAPQAHAACSYFAALERDVTQPSQRALITWDPEGKVETFTVQPVFQGNADDFGMVIPTPAQPKLKEAPRDIFKDLALYTVLEPRPCTKRVPKTAGSYPSMARRAEVQEKSTVRVLEAGVVGTLDYKIITAEKASDLYAWLKEHQYSYAGDEATLDFYVKKKWFFTVMKIDPKQMKRDPSGNYTGEVSPTRFQFSSAKLVYPLRITSLSVKDQTEALFYVLTTRKIALPQSKLEYAKRLKGADLDKLDKGLVPIPQSSQTKGQAPQHDFKGLKGWLKKGEYLTKVRRVFRKEEMTDDLELAFANDNEEYTSYEDCGVPP
jgi:hypothetical protein